MRPFHVRLYILSLPWLLTDGVILTFCRHDKANAEDFMVLRGSRGVRRESWGLRGGGGGLRRESRGLGGGGDMAELSA